MLMPVRPMHMTVGQFLGRCRAHVGHFQAEAQHLAGPGVVAVEQHRVALDLDHVEHLIAAIGGAALQLAAHFHARRKVAARHGLRQAFVAQAEGVLGLQQQAGLVTHRLAVQRGLDFGQGVAVAAVQVGHGFLGFFEELALGVRHFVAQGHNGVFFDFHGA